VILLVHRRQPAPRPGARWIYLGRDYLDLKRWETRLGPDQRVSFADRIGDVSARLQAPFLEWLAQVAKRYAGSLDWWMTPLAGKTLPQLPLFLNVCYLHLLDELVNATDDRLIVVCEDWFLLSAVRTHLREAGRAVRRTTFWPLWLSASAALQAVRFLARYLWHINGLLKALVAARLTRAGIGVIPGDPGKWAVLLHTCIDDECFGEGHVLRDRYYGRLPQWLVDHGCEVTTIPWVYNSRRSVFELDRWFRASQQRFLVVEDYLCLGDYLRCSAQILRTGLVPRGERRLLGQDVRSLLWRERIHNASAVERMRFLLYEPALRRWLRMGHVCNVYIDMFENMYPERPPIRALRAFSPGTLIVGYQHASVPGEMLAGSVTAEEWQTGIFPDWIVANGSTGAELLVRRGFPSANVAVGPALRMEYLIAQRARRQADTPSAAYRRAVLVLLPLDMAESVELVAQLMACTEVLRARGAPVMLRVHPMMSVALFLRRAGIRQLPPGWHVGTGPLVEQLPEAAVVVGTGTAALLDAAALGVPAVCLGRELAATYNPLEVWADRFPWCRTVPPKRLGERLDEILSAGVEGGELALQELSATLVAGLGQVDDRHLEVFMGRAAPGDLPQVHVSAVE
jgi:surface carbohydrate biosynthesis protein (TIGR04326 family)